MIYIDPAIDLHTPEFVQVIIEFKTLPAHVAILATPTLSLEQATEQVELSHSRFQMELELFLGKRGYPYLIFHQYKDSFNGVSLELPGISIRELLASQVIRVIHPNREMRIPENPIV